MPPLNDGDFKDLGLQPPDTIRTPHIDVSEMVDFVIHLSNIRELDELPHHTMASRTPHTLTFEEGQRGKTIQIAIAWQNERSHLGQWSEYKSTIIP
jgi:hypothetical protein